VQIERVSVGSVRPDPDNVRQHDDDQIELMKSSLLEYGQQKPIVVDSSGKVRAGSGILVAAIALGWTEIEIVRTELDGAKAKAYGIVDNHLSDRSRFDTQMLDLELGKLAEHGIDLSELGLSPSEQVDDGEEEEDAADLITHPTLPPPKMAWALIGIPTVRYREIATTVEALAKVPGISCETVVNGRDS
jgi:ParB-like chromosome segregation protein Spo0J